MTLTYGFFDSVSEDRKYNAVQFGEIFDGVIIDGVFESIGDALEVVPNTGLYIYVGTGRAWFDSTWTKNDADLSLQVSTPHVTFPRIDTVVLETNYETGVRANDIKIIAGTPSSTPVPPTLTHTSTVNQYPLADIYVEANATEIDSGDISNRIGTEDCPYATGPADLAVGDLEDRFEAHTHVGGEGMQIPTDGLANNSVDDTKAGNRVPQFYRRQGGSSSDWSITGNSNYTPTAVRIQAGVKHVVVTSKTGEATVTLPVAFSNKPIVLASPLWVYGLLSSGESWAVDINNITASSFELKVWTVSQSDCEFDVHWIAIGPE